MPKISVVVPVYNSETYLDACLVSLLQQTFSDIEIICVDDGSTDFSYLRLKQYAEQDQRVHVYQQENQGVVVARNTALHYATGDWIAFCDSDDTVPLDAYEKLFAATQGTNAVDVVIGDFYDIDDYGVTDRALRKPTKNMSSFSVLFRVPCVWTKLIRRTYLQQNQLFFPDLKLGEDVTFLAQLAVLQPNCQVIPNAVYYHWNHNKEIRKSLNHRYDYEHFLLHVNCREELLRICYQEAEIREAYYYVYHNMIGFLVDYLFRIQEFHDKEKALMLLKKHLQGYNWTNEMQRFECLIGIPYEIFFQMDAAQYFTTTKLLNPEEMVLKRYEAGMMGFRYILKYAKAWTNYKLKRFYLERKK